MHDEHSQSFPQRSAVWKEEDFGETRQPYKLSRLPGTGQDDNGMILQGRFKGRPQGPRTIPPSFHAVNDNHSRHEFNSVFGRDSSRHCPSVDGLLTEPATRALRSVTG